MSSLIKTKKIVLFIVEGRSEKTSLGRILNVLLSHDRIEFYVYNGDVTSDFKIDATNIVSKVGDLINNFVRETIGIKKSDIIQVVHLVDLDGAFVSNDSILLGSEERIIYTDTSILANSINQVINRNKKKSQVLDRLSNHSKVSQIPYEIYYFSCNLEHVLFNQMNVLNEDKIEMAYEFDDSYFGHEHEFIDFIRSREIAAIGTYTETWEFIKQNNNSLKRYSNFHLFFDNYSK